MRRAGLPPIVWALTFLLISASILIIFARQEKESSPSANAIRPSGVRALAELLQKDGYEIQVESSWNPQISQAQVAVAFFPPSSSGTDSASSQKEIIQTLETYAAKGGVVLAITMPSAFDRASESSKVGELIDELSREKRSITVSSQTLEAPSPASARKSFQKWQQGGLPFVIVYPIDKGYWVTASDGLFVSNRFLSKEQNASFALEMFRTLAPQLGKIVFVDSSYRMPPKPSVFAAIGNWAAVGRNQVILLFVLGCWILGARFGLPKKPPRKEQGARELVDAIGDTLHRGKQTGLALKYLCSEVDQRIRSVLQLHSGASAQERDALLPSPLRDSLNAVENATRQSKLSSKDALRLAQSLEIEVAKLERSQKSTVRL